MRFFFAHQNLGRFGILIGSWLYADIGRAGWPFVRIGAQRYSLQPWPLRLRRWL